MTQFWSSSSRKQFGAILDKLGIESKMSDISSQNGRLHIEKTPTRLVIGDVAIALTSPLNPELVPKPVFHDIPRHVSILQDILRDLKTGEKHILMIGNQGKTILSIHDLSSKFDTQHFW